MRDFMRQEEHICLYVSLMDSRDSPCKSSVASLVVVVHMPYAFVVCYCTLRMYMNADESNFGRGNAEEE